MYTQNHFEDLPEQDALDNQIRLQELEDWLLLEQPIFENPIEVIGNDEF